MSKNNDIALAEDSKPEETGKTETGKKYASFKHSFRDPWEDADVEMDFHFSKPTKTQIKRLTDTASRQPTQASRDLLLSTIHPDEKEALLTKLEDYPGLASSYSAVLLKSVGISADLGN